MLIKMGDLGQAMVSLSQTVASLEQFKGNYEGLKLKAYVRLAHLKLLMGETPDAFTQLSQSLFPRVCEQDDASLTQYTLILLAKACIKMAQVPLRSDEDVSEERKPNDENDFTLYKEKFYMKALCYLKQALPLSMGLNCLKSLNEEYYLVSVVS